MIDTNMQKALDNANNLQEKKRIQLIRQGVGKIFPHPSDETAIARKSIHLLLSYMAQKHPEIKDTKEYQEAMSWYNDIEAIKAKATTETT